jgi:cyanate permease
MIRLKKEALLIKKNRFSKIYFGWWTIIVTGIVSGLSLGFNNYGLSVMFKSISTDLKLSRTSTSWASAIGRLQAGMQAPVTGWLSDRFGSRWVIITGLFIVCSGLILMNYINSTWSFYVVWGTTVGIGSSMANALAVDKALTNWFIEKRGLAIGIRFVLIGVCGAIVLPVVTWLVGLEGWRTTCMIWAGVVFTGIPLSWYFVKQKRPEYYGLLPDGAKVESGSEKDINSMINQGIEYAAGFNEIEYTIRQAIKTRAFWLITIAWMCALPILGGFNLHCIPFLTDMGIDENVAGTMMAMMVFFTVPARFLGGFLSDRVKKEHQTYLVACAFFIQAMGISTFLFHQNVATMYVMLIMYGFGSGAPVPIRLSMGGRYFGRKSFASIQGTIGMLGAPISFMAPIFAGWIWDNHGSYVPAFQTYAVLATIASFLMLFVRPPKPPTQVTDINKLF